ncbi:hypothetical protein OT109_17120 [Phycisphaeraceae bacterium D3-23]
MTPPPPDDQTASTDADKDPASAPTAPGRGLLVVRFAVVVLLSIGLLVFAIYAFNDLAQGLDPPPDATATGTLALNEEGSSPLAGGDLLQPGSASDALSEGYTPIDHDPAHLPAYPGAERNVCHRLKPDGRYNDEQAVYTVTDIGAQPQDVMDHYRAAAQSVGFTVHTSRPNQSRPGSISTLFIRGEETFTVTVNPLRPAPPQMPSLSVDVHFRYPIASRP